MKLFKRSLSLLLTVAMLLGIAMIPSADSTPPVELSLKFYTANDGATPVSSVNAGDSFFVFADFANNPKSETASICTYCVMIGYDTAKVTVGAKMNKDTSPQTFNKAYATGVAQTQLAGLDPIYDDEAEVKTSGTLFSVKMTASAAMTAAELAQAVTLIEASGTSATKLLDVNGNLLPVIGIPKTIGTVTLSETSKEVNGTNLTVTAAAKSSSDAVITSLVNWTVEPATGGVTVAADGTVTIDGKATPGDYYIVAGANSANMITGTVKEKLTVTRAASVATTVTVDAKTVAIPAKTAGTASVALTGKVLDQFGSEMTADITWTLENTGATGAVIDGTNAKVTYTGEAGAADIKGTVDAVSGTAKLTVTKAEPVVTEVAVFGPAAINIPEVGDTATETYNVEVRDQYGQSMAGKTVTWSFVVADGLGVDQTGKVTVTSAAVAGAYELTATVDTVTSVPIIITVSDLPAQEITFAVTSESKTYGDASFTDAATNATVGCGATTYASSNTAVATVNATTGEVTIVGAGETTITATAARVEGLYAATSASYTLAVAKKTLTASDLEFKSSADATKTYDTTTASDEEVQVKAASFVNPSDVVAVSGTAAYDAATVAGATQVTFTTELLDDPNYALAAGLTLTKTGTITPAAVTPEIAAIAAQEYTGAQITPAITVTPDTLVKDTDYTVSYGTNKDAGTAAGTVTITAKSGSNYSFTDVNASFDITPKTVAVDWTKDTAYAYNGAEQTAPTASFTGLGTDGTINCTVTEDGGKTFKNAGTYSFTAATTNTNYTLTGAAVTVEIAKAILEPIIDTVAPKTYDGTTDATGTITFIGAFGSDHPTGTATFTWTSAAVDTYTVNVTNIKLDDAFTANYEVADDKLYDISCGTTIAKAAAPMLEVSGEQFLLSNEVTTESKGYFFKLGTLISGIPEDAGNIVYSISSSGTYAAGTIVPTDNLFIQVDSPAAAETVDSVFVTVQSENYEDASVEVVFIFKSKKVVDDRIILFDITVTYGEGFTPDYTYIGSMDDTSEWTYTYEGTGSTVYAASETAPTAAGTYKITADYSDAIVEGGIPGHIGTTTANLTITAKELTVTDGTLAITKAYDGTATKGTLTGALELTGVVTGDTVSLDTAAQTCADYSAADAGTYTVQIGGLALTGADAANYTVAATYDFTKAEITKIDPTTAELDFTLANADYDGTAKAVTVAAKSTVTGLGAITVKYNGETAAPVEDGTYTVTASIAAGTNYNAKDLELGSFTITDNRTATITFKHADGSTETVTYNKANKTADLPLDVKAGYNFKGWVLSTNGSAVTGYTAPIMAMTNDLLTAIDESAGTKTLTAESEFVSMGGIKTYAVNVKTAANGKLTASAAKSPAKITVVVKAVPDTGCTIGFVKVVDASGNEIALTEKGEGEYSFAMPASAVTVSAKFLKDGESLVGFTDVAASDYFFDAVEWAVEEGITEGTSATTFSPYGLTTRAQVVTFLWRMAGEPVVNYAMNFSDLTGETWYTEAVRWAASEKYVEGFEDGTFKPGDKVTREQLAAILYRIAEKKGMGFVGASMFLMPFSDLADIHDYAFNGVRWCYMKKIIEGKGDNVLDPRGVAKRAEVITMLYRFNDIISK